ncbi:MAG: hypothetical protein EBR82_00175 [Caulobacteraceae bacterium]|nr:hypothetical protein [Caulobacteraceae bacterium]
MKRYAWCSDIHMDISWLPFLKRLYAMNLERAGADGLFLTGDVSSGPFIESDLAFIAKHFKGPVYFVLGNHDYYGRHIESVHDDVRRVCRKHSNLHWMTDQDIVSLEEDVALIGTEGWYDGRLGLPDHLRWTLDRAVVIDFFHMSSMEERIEAWRAMADRSADIIGERLERALQTHKTVYILTHFPPWGEATTASGTKQADFWLPYNTNFTLGQRIEEVMQGRKKKRCIVLAGHTHYPCRVRVSNSVECMVARAKYFGEIRPEETLVV